METKVLIGVDPHKATNALAVLDEHGELLERTQFPTDRKGLEALERWAANFPRRKWAVEGANGLGRTLAHRLVSAGENVVDVPPKLSARVRVLSIGHGPRTTSWTPPSRHSPPGAMDAWPGYARTMGSTP
jgi:transposase